MAVENKRGTLYSDCYSCSKCIHYGDCVDSDDDYNFTYDDIDWTYIYASENDKEIRKNG